ncbi:SPFH domain-containing protein [Cellulomonas sp. JH27-2]|uniref:SPFH domain-containing protein n=1 Tax=Cellulomonas sp. JH27-2 TaxID=2774139 RepID=UPI00178435D3|nr:SPFH domain-containing protein [Cellulomonas sp. JH27-2]
MPGLFVFSLVLLVVAAVAGAVWFVGRRRVAARVAAGAAADVGAPVVEPSDEPDDEPASGRRTKSKRPSAVRTPDPQAGPRTAGWVAVGAATFAVVFAFFSAATIVSTKNVGIETSFGRPVGSLSNGFHLVPPWNKVTEMDAAIQTDNHVKGGSHVGCITVRIAHQATACVDTSIRWRIEEPAADALFRDYRDFDNVRDSLVTRDLNAALNAAFEDYDPLAIDKDGNSTSPGLESQSEAVLNTIRGQIGDEINVLSVIIPVVHYDDNTQSKVNALLAQVAQTRIAEQSVITAQQQALANQTLAQSVSKDPNVLVSKCIDLLGEMVSKGQSIPIGFSCWPGGASSVVVPGVSTPTK